jgi:nicotinic acid mononucleotide adenylyltransferase
LEERNNEQLTTDNGQKKIFITDAVQIDVSATEIRQKIRENVGGWREFVPEEVVKYVEKYKLYQ